MLFVKSKRMQGQADFWFHHTTRTSHILAVVRISKKIRTSEFHLKLVVGVTGSTYSYEPITVNMESSSSFYFFFFFTTRSRQYLWKHFFYDHSWLSHQHKRVPWRMNGTDFLWLPAAIRFSFSSVFCYDFIIFRYVAEKWNISQTESDWDNVRHATGK